jgi:hypothetical protein
MAVIGNLFTTVVAMLIVKTNGIDASLAGFVLLFSLSYSSAIIFAVHSFVDCGMGRLFAAKVFKTAC